MGDVSTSFFMIWIKIMVIQADTDVDNNSFVCKPPQSLTTINLYGAQEEYWAYAIELIFVTWSKKSGSQNYTFVVVVLGESYIYMDIIFITRLFLPLQLISVQFTTNCEMNEIM